MPLTLVEKLMIADIRRFRTERIKKIKTGETPKALDTSKEFAKIVLHLIPLDAFEAAQIYNLSFLNQDLNPLKPPYSSIKNGEYNFHGFCVYGHPAQGAKDSVHSYAHVFHSGIIEIVDIRFLLDEYFRGQAFREGLIQAIPRYLSVQKRLGVSPPIFLMLSLLHVKGYGLDPVESFDSNPIQEEDLLVPEIQIDDWASDPAQLMKPILDIVWNAFGLPDSPA